MHSACNHLLLYNRPFSKSHQFGVSLRNSSANIWKRSVAGIHVKSKADFKNFLSLWFDIQFTQYVLSPDLTWVRQISNDFARSRVAFFRDVLCVFGIVTYARHPLRKTTACLFLKCNCRLVERIFSLIVSLIATPNQVLYFCSIKKSLVWFYFSIHNHFDENHREKSLCSSPSIGTITLSSSLFPHVWFYFLVPPVAVPNHNCTVICNISGLSVGAAQTTNKEISSA